MDRIEIPARYLEENELDYHTPDDFHQEDVIIGEGDKLIWNFIPDWRLIQIYSIQFLNQDREALRQICGTIELDDAGDCFDRKPGGSIHDIDEEASLSLSLCVCVCVCDDIEDIWQQGFVRLSGCECPLWAEDYVEMNPKVYRGNQPGDLFHPLNAGIKYISCKDVGMDIEGEFIDGDCLSELDKPGAYGVHLSSPGAFRAETCDELLNKDIPTTCGTMRLTYAVLSCAADCYVTIQLLEWTGEGSAANLYGKVIASDTRVTDKRAKSSVFLMEKDEAISVSEGQYIPLQRPCIAVSMGHHLVLDIGIRHQNDTVIESKVHFRTKCGNGDDVNAVTPLSSSKESDDDNWSPFSSKKSDQTGSQDSDQESDNDWNGGGIYEAKELSGNYCKIQIKVFWLPCWSKPM